MKEKILSCKEQWHHCQQLFYFFLLQLYSTPLRLVRMSIYIYNQDWVRNLLSKKPTQFYFPDKLISPTKGGLALFLLFQLLDHLLPVFVIFSLTASWRKQVQLSPSTCQKFHWWWERRVEHRGWGEKNKSMTDSSLKNRQLIIPCAPVIGFWLKLGKGSRTFNTEAVRCTLN